MGSVDNFSVYQLSNSNLFEYVQTFHCGFTITGLSITADLVKSQGSDQLLMILVTGANNLKVYSYNPQIGLYTEYFTYTLPAGITILASSISTNGRKIICIYRNPTHTHISLQPNNYKLYSDLELQHRSFMERTSYYSNVGSNAVDMWECLCYEVDG